MIQVVQDFIPALREELGSVMDQLNFREVDVVDLNSLKLIKYISDRRVLELFLDVRDGYVDVHYGDASTLDSDERLKKPAAEFAATYRDVSQLLKAEGVLIPIGGEKLYQPGVLRETMRVLVDAMKRHSEEVLGVPWETFR